ncbi:cell division protein [Mannheimia sp. USDA-ARS-USMARC-1261]|uniref:cell division protein FtsN n=1 Tax=Mannheimia sp. USDA-ARS-USMARC-1261 TaxID=1432056 RepID=UPI0003E34B64|nr:cell division protein FtsN [Mannheimia sp. USDA-ARS-USMARC-1261]AHG74368.1 cell division protein [Mannheimia sp. USDA-ARS-USMARC-1261]
MPQRDYVARSNEKKSKKTQKESALKKVLILIIGLILGCGIALWLLKANAPAPTTVSNTAQPVQQQPKSQLPSRPEESWSYIRDLETRTVITDNNQTSQERLAQLTTQQKQQIEERRKQEEARLAEQVQQNSTVETPAETTDKATIVTQEPQLSDEALAAKKAEEEALAKQKIEEKRKQDELKKQQAKLAEEKAKKEQPAKIVASAATPADKAANQAGKFGLQCGAFKNKAQAENMQARLAMAGFNARIASSADWNRVFVGPVGDRAATSRAQSNARSVAECVIVAM